MPFPTLSFGYAYKIIPFRQFSVTFERARSNGIAKKNLRTEMQGKEADSNRY